MAEVEIRAVSKAFKKTQAVSDLSLTVGDGEFVAPARADRRRQDDDIAPDRRTGDAGPWFDPDRRTRRDRRRAGRSRRRFRVPAVFVVSASDRVREHGFALRAPIRRVPEAEIRAKVRKSRVFSTSKPSWTTRQRSCRADRCSGLRSAGPWCARPRSI